MQQQQQQQQQQPPLIPLTIHRYLLTNLNNHKPLSAPIYLYPIPSSVPDLPLLRNGDQYDLHYHFVGAPSLR